MQLHHLHFRHDDDEPREIRTKVGKDPSSSIISISEEPSHTFLGCGVFACCLRATVLGESHQHLIYSVILHNTQIGSSTKVLVHSAHLACVQRTTLSSWQRWNCLPAVRGWYWNSVLTCFGMTTPSGGLAICLWIGGFLYMTVLWQRRSTKFSTSSEQSILLNDTFVL